MGVTVLYPDASRVIEPLRTDIPVLYLCMECQEIRIGWPLAKPNVERLVAEPPHCFIMPNTNNGWYADTCMAITTIRFS